MILMILTQIPQFWRLLSRIRYLKSPELDILITQQPPFSIKWFASAFTVSVLFWSIVGLGFRQLVIAVNVDAAHLSWLQSTSIFTLAWGAGFVIIFAPAGLGVREVALTYLLGSVLPAGEALSVALLSRLWWIVTETIYIFISLIWFSGTANRSILTKLRLAKQEEAKKPD